MERFIADQYPIHSTTEPPLPDGQYDALLRADSARHYTESRDVWTAESAMREAVDGLVAALQGCDDAHVLDIGSGRGVDTRHLLACGYRVTSIDLVDCAEWEEIAACHGDRVRFHRAGLLDV